MYRRWSRPPAFLDPGPVVKTTGGTIQVLMPLYEYKCESCGKTFELIQKFSDEPLKTHPECGGIVEKVISAPAFHLKGTGWYATDYGKRNGKSEESKSESKSEKSESKSESSSPSSDSKSSGESKSDSKPAAQSESKPSESKPSPTA
jgi:putative FmdB family regulatory protein